MKEIINKPKIAVEMHTPENDPLVGNMAYVTPILADEEADVDLTVELDDDLDSDTDIAEDYSLDEVVVVAPSIAGMATLTTGMPMGDANDDIAADYLLDEIVITAPAIAHNDTGVDETSVLPEMEQEMLVDNLVEVAQPEPIENFSTDPNETMELEPIESLSIEANETMQPESIESILTESIDFPQPETTEIGVSDAAQEEIATQLLPSEMEEEMVEVDELLAMEEIDPNDIESTNILDFDSVGTIIGTDGREMAMASYHDEGQHLLLVDTDGDQMFDAIAAEDGHVLINANYHLSVEDVSTMVDGNDGYLTSSDVVDDGLDYSDDFIKS